MKNAILATGPQHVFFAPGTPPPNSFTLTETDITISSRRAYYLAKQTLQAVYRSFAFSLLIAFLLFFRYRQPSLWNFLPGVVTNTVALSWPGGALTDWVLSPRLIARND